MARGLDVLRQFIVADRSRTTACGTRSKFMRSGYDKRVYCGLQ